MKPFFTASDFAAADLRINIDGERRFISKSALDEIVLYCNKKLEREGVVVYGYTHTDGGTWSEINDIHDTHRAIIISIEEIEKKCEHEYVDRVDEESDVMPIFQCSRCGRILKPTWEEVK